MKENMQKRKFWIRIVPNLKIGRLQTDLKYQKKMIFITFIEKIQIRMESAP